MNYYNEHDLQKAAWLEELIKQGVISYGIVDTRDIKSITPDELAGYTQCHFFAGIGGWSYALRLAGWPDDKPVWTGSCPCQSFSTAGKRKGTTDERHLWPAWFWLIQQSQPGQIFGEQVSSTIEARSWLDLVQDDLEACGYTCGSLDIPACSVGAPHRRNRYYFGAVGNPQYIRLKRDGRRRVGEPAVHRRLCEYQRSNHHDDTLANGHQASEHTNSGPVRTRRGHNSGRCGGSECMDDSSQVGRKEAWGRNHRAADGVVTEPNVIHGPWDSPDWALCRNPESRGGGTFWRPIPTEPAFFPLANGIPARILRLCGYGDAIVPQLAAAFVRAWEEVLDDV